MTIQRLNYLLSRWEGNALSSEETKELIQWYRSYEAGQGLTESLTALQKDQLEAWMWEGIQAGLEANGTILGRGMAQAWPPADMPPDPVRSLGPQSPVRRLKPLWKWSAVAAILLMAGAVGYKYFIAEGGSNIPAPLAHHKPLQTDAAPGGNHALLTLGDGKVISLDSVGTGVLSHVAGTSITKKAEGELTYATGLGSPVVYNTLSTPKGGQYQIVLPDGTHVWMNAASTLKYPTQFGEKDRTVELTGEAYFEVAKDRGKPFFVTTPNMRVAVLGTAFNVMDYPKGRQSATTLVQGSVKVSQGNQDELLKPGQQASISELKNHIKVLDDVDLTQVTAWKNGFFQFDDVDLPTIMEQVARWYDIEVVYSGPVSTDKYRGKISRNVPLSQLLKILELGGVKFELHDKTLTVR
jgi:transmembrane sensor